MQMSPPSRQLDLLMPSLSPDRPLKAPVENPLPVARKTLLIVDDEEGPRQSLRIVFKDDYNLLLAENGPKAVDLARLNVIDAVVLDIRMSGMSGIEVLNRLKEINPAIEVIMLTAYETLETARQALRLGACDYLTKPFDIATMRNSVAKAMERRSLSNQIRINFEKLQELQDEIRDEKVRAEITRTRGEIYASIIHDINGPLTVISGLIENISHHIGNANTLTGEDLGVVKDRLTRITVQVGRCIEISRRYLSFLRDQSAVQTRVDLNQILTDLWELLKFHPSIKDNELIIHPADEEVQLEINGTDFIQILLNLTINALQATLESHRIQVKTRLMPTPLDTGKLKNGPNDRYLNLDSFMNEPPLLAVWVDDNGPGIPAASLNKIFDPYFTTKPKTQGTGLGLAIVQRLVREMKGVLHVHSQEGKGARFTIFLSIRPRPAPPSAPS